MNTALFTIFYSIFAINNIWALFKLLQLINGVHLTPFRKFYISVLAFLWMLLLLLSILSMFLEKTKNYQIALFKRVALKNNTVVIIVSIFLLISAVLGNAAIYFRNEFTAVSMIAGSASAIFMNWLSLLAVSFSWLLLSLNFPLFNKDEEQIRNTKYWLRSILWASLPVFATLILVATLYSSSPLNYRPFYSDEMFFWHQAKTFSYAGFGGGYYTYYELPAKASFTRFGPHGPVYPIVYGSLGAIFGWHAYSGILFNHILLMAAFILFVKITNIPQNKLWLTGLAYAFFPPVLFYAGSNWYESLNQAMAILMASLLWMLLKKGDGASTRLRLIYLGLGFVYAVTRPTWAMIMIPLVFLCTSTLEFSKRLIFTIFGGIGLAFLAYRLWSYMASPYGLFLPGSGFEIQKISISDRIISLLGTTQENLFYLSSQSFYSIEIMIPVSAVIILLYSIYILAQKKQNSPLNTLFWKDYFVDVFNIYNISLTLAFLFPFLPIGGLRGFRYLGTSLLLSFFLLLVQKRYKVVLVIIVINLICLPSLIDNYGKSHYYNYRNYFEQNVESEFKLVVEEYISYQPSLNGWCNSLLVEEDPQPFMSIPAGIGIAAKFEDDNTSLYQIPLNSHYIILDRNPPGNNWKWLASTYFGDLYQNTNIECEPETSFISSK